MTNTAQPRRRLFTFKLRDARGELIDFATEAAPVEWSEGQDAFIPGLERLLASLPAGVSQGARLSPEDGYGVVDPSLIQAVPRDVLPPGEIRPGDTFRAGPDPQAPFVRILSVEGDLVRIDANHPLAGLELDLQVTVLRDLGG